MYGFHQWAPLNLWILFRFDQQVKGVEGYRQETREGDKSKIGIFILYPFSSLPSGSACALFFKKGHISFQLVLSTQISSGSSMVSSLSSSDNGAPLLLALGTWSTLYVFFVALHTSFKQSPNITLSWKLFWTLLQESDLPNRSFCNAILLQSTHHRIKWLIG